MTFITCFKEHGYTELQNDVRLGAQIQKIRNRAQLGLAVVRALIQTGLKNGTQLY